MKIVNNSKNTIYIEDLDMHLAYRDGEPEDISLDLLKRSRALRSVILSDMIDIVEYDPSERIENSLVYLKKKPKKQPVQAEESVVPDAPPLSVCSDAIDVKIHGIFYDAGGYAKVNRNLAIRLKEMGFNVLINPKRSQNQLNEEELKPFIDLTKTKVSKNHILIDSVIPSFGEMSSGKYKVLYTTIESYTVPKQLIECCNQYDEIWLTSEWSANILRPLIDKPVYTVVTGVDQNHYQEGGQKFDFKPNIKSFVFISVFGWNYRKGYDVLLKAYFDEFSEDDDVSLLIVSRYQSGQSRYHKNKIRDDIEEIMKGFPNKDLPHVVRYSKIISEKDMPKLYRAANCFVLPSRGEGGCLPPLEASLCGLPVIMSNCSGQQGYLRSDNAYLLDIDFLDEIRSGQMHLHYWDGQKFPAFNTAKAHNQMRSLMRSVVNNYQEAKTRNRRMQKLIMEKFTWNHTANAAAERLKAIHEKMRG